MNPQRRQAARETDVASGLDGLVSSVIQVDAAMTNHEDTEDTESIFESPCPSCLRGWYAYSAAAGLGGRCESVCCHADLRATGSRAPLTSAPRRVERWSGA